MKLQFNDKVYDILKWLCLIAARALRALQRAGGRVGLALCAGGRDHH